MLNVNELSGFGAGGGGKRFYRLYMHSSYDSGSKSFAYIQMRAVATGATGGTTPAMQSCVGGTAIASGTYNVNAPPADAFDEPWNNYSVYWDNNTNWYASAPGQGKWVGYEFPSAIDIKEIYIVAGGSNGVLTNPNGITVQVAESIDGPWTTLVVWDGGSIGWVEYLPGTTQHGAILLTLP